MAPQPKYQNPGNLFHLEIYDFEYRARCSERKVIQLNINQSECFLNFLDLEMKKLEKRES